MTERQVQYWLWVHMRSANRLMLPNYTPAGWWECDLWALTHSNFWTEHEIKLTVVDFKRDAGKGGKHDAIAMRGGLGPSRFWFVVPEKLVGVDEVPSWAGLKWVRGHANGMCIWQEKPAPQLHRVRASDSLIKHAHSVSYWRFWGEVGRRVTA